MSTILGILGAALALVIAWRKPTPVPEGAEWPTWPEWTVQAFGVALMSTAAVRVFVAMMVSS